MKELMEEGRDREQAGRFDEAAKVYQRIVDKDPGDRDAVKRLLMMYRRLKDFAGELSTIEAGLGAIAKKDQSAQGKWLSANPRAAKLGKAMLRSLGGAQASVYGTDPFVQQLLKRKDLVERKINGVKKTKNKPKGKRPGRGAKSEAAPQPLVTRQPGLLRVMPSEKGAVQGKSKPDRKKNRLEALRKKEDTTAKRQAKRAAAAEKKQEKLAATRAAAQEKRETAARAKEKAAEIKKAERAAAIENNRKAAEAKKAAAKTAHLPSFFVITLRYLVPLTRIDAAMEKHVAFLDKYFTGKVFLMAGRQVPRTGGIIIARGKNRNLITRIMRQDPFVKGQLASYDVVEFKPSRRLKLL